MNKLYETNHELWLTYQQEFLKNHNWNNLDIDNLIQELEGLNRSNKRELKSYMTVLIAHLLKWEYQPLLRSRSWSASIKNSRTSIVELLEDHPSLKNQLSQILSSAYINSVEWAAEETGIKVSLFSKECLYTVEQLLDKNWFPD